MLTYLIDVFVFLSADYLLYDLSISSYQSSCKETDHTFLTTKLTHP